MTDIFFSYKSDDRNRVSHFHKALVDEGFVVFWDQTVQTGVDWDAWIREQLTKSKCVMVFWSTNSIASDNVRHEATIAKRQGKLIHVLLEPLMAEQLPMGLYTQQAANLPGSNLDPTLVEHQIIEVELELLIWRVRSVSLRFECEMH